MTTIGSRSSSKSVVTACWWRRSASLSRRLISLAGPARPLLFSSAVRPSRIWSVHALMIPAS